MVLKLPYGLKNGELVHISAVEKGLKCSCVCPGCKHPLIARKGNRMAHHFAHANQAECSKGVETAIHLAAKDILAKHQKIRLPKVEVEFNSYRENWLVSEDCIIQFNEVKLEYRMDDIIPDIFVTVKGRPLMIEITVTHKTGHDKIEKIKKLGISCLEIDLSKLDKELSVEKLEQIIVEDVEHKNWLYNVKSQTYKKRALSYTEAKVVFQRGFAMHVDACPIRTRVYRGRSYANVVDDCLSSCDYCLQVGNGEGYGSLDIIHCAGAKRIKNISDL